MVSKAWKGEEAPPFAVEKQRASLIFVIMKARSETKEKIMTFEEILPD